MEKVIIYQALVRLFGNSVPQCKPNGTISENGVGKMNHFTNTALQNIKNLGITHVWYTGIIAHARCFGNPDYNLPAQNSTIVKGMAGSPYAITDYYDINADIAVNIPERMDEFKQLINRTHYNGLKAIIDFVPNHVARQYKSTIFPERTFGLDDEKQLAFSPSNDFYYLPGETLKLPTQSGTISESIIPEPYIENPPKATGNDRFSATLTQNDWYETVKLNYGIDYLNNHAKHFTPTPPLWQKMVDILLFWAEKGIDGFRCDMVEMVPVEFWAFASEKVKEKFPNILFIGEVYNPMLYKDYLNIGKFDFLYDKVGLYDSIREITVNHTSTNLITTSWQAVNGISHKMLSFMENHDEQRIASPFFAGNAENAMPGMAVTATINKGAVMVYFGQEIGEPAAGAPGFSGYDGRTTIFDYYNVPEHQKWMNNGSFDGLGLSDKQKKLQQWYSQLLNFTKKCEAIAHGEFYDMLWTSPFKNASLPGKLYAYLRYTQANIVLVLVNFSTDHGQSFILNIPEDALKKSGILQYKQVKLKSVFSDSNDYTAWVNEIVQRGIWFNMKPLGVKIFEVIPLKND